MVLASYDALDMTAWFNILIMSADLGLMADNLYIWDKWSFEYKPFHCIKPCPSPQLKDLLHLQVDNGKAHYVLDR